MYFYASCNMDLVIIVKIEKEHEQRNFRLKQLLRQRRTMFFLSCSWPMICLDFPKKGETEPFVAARAHDRITLLQHIVQTITSSPLATAILSISNRPIEPTPVEPTLLFTIARLRFLQPLFLIVVRGDESIQEVRVLSVHCGTATWSGERGSRSRKSLRMGPNFQSEGWSVMGPFSQMCSRIKDVLMMMMMMRMMRQRSELV